MKRRILTIVCILISFLTSCMSELDVESVTPENTVQIFTEIESSNSLSRANIGIDGKGSFVENDQISLLYDEFKSNLQLISGRWTPNLSWDDIKGGAVFSAFYPILPTTNNKLFDHEVAVDQNSGDQFEKSDLLYAEPVSVKEKSAVKLKFKHLMSCLTVVLKGDAYTAEEFASATVQVKSYNKIQVAENGTFGKLYDYNHGVNNMSVITFAHKGEGTFQAALCPQNIQNVSYGEGWWLKITIAGKEYKVADPPKYLNGGISFNELESGKNVTLVYSFYEKDPEFSNRLCWVHGLKDIPDPSTSDWKVFHTDPKSGYTRKHLPWDAKYGWYDCNKKSTTDSKFDDMNMCWAATSSNMIHWWYDQNQTFIDSYYKQHTEKQDSISHSYKDSHDSKVFDVFKFNFIDEGGYIKNGLNWFFLSKYDDAPENAAKLLNEGSGGYFKDVFGANSSMVEVVGVLDMNTLSSALKSAFRKHQAIGFAVLMKGFGSAHAMTIWGAKFDEYGQVTHIYYTDNNDGTLDSDIVVGLIEARVGEYAGTEYPEFKGKACLENSQGKTAIYIRDLTMLNLRQDDWNNLK